MKTKKFLLQAGIFSMLACLTFVLLACAPGQPKPASPSDTANNSSSEAAITIPPWSPDSDCSVCHTTESESLGNSECLVSLHDAQGVECSSCHTDEATLATVHDSSSTPGEMPKTLEKTTVGSDVCTTCHDVKELAAKTEDVTILTDAEGTVINPHSIPVNDSHESGVSCTSCHVMHTANVLTDSAQQTCLSCHHAGVYECGTCHD